MTILDEGREIVERIHGHFFFVDIVGLSDPNKGGTESQIARIKTLHNAIGKCNAYLSTLQEKKYVNLTGDGMVIGFLDDPILPLELAIQLHKELVHYNKKKDGNEQVHIRIGIDSAPIMKYIDIFGKENVWGDGIVLAKRTMDVGDAGHILLTYRSAEGLMQFNNYRGILHQAGEYPIKHGLSVRLYSAYGEGFGNPQPPKVEGKTDTRAEGPLITPTGSAINNLREIFKSEWGTKRRTAKEIAEVLDANGIPDKYLSQNLDRLVQHGELRNKKQNGVFVYWKNPDFLRNK